ncbi:MAG: sterol desaturase family protein [Gemmatimonadetes bacterium]|nr:sterol desaturase family protein [Gemmatimonadota bacterium]
MLETLAAALPDPVAWAIPAFMVLILIEVWWSHRALPQSYELKDTAASLMMGAGNLAIGVAYGGLVYTATAWVYERRLFDLPRAWWIFPAVLLAEDFIYYWFHRLSHEHRVWWAAHVNHHSSQHLNLATALRQSWTGNLAFVWVLWLPLAWLGFPPGIIAFQKGISLVYQFWIHTEAIRRLPGWVEWVFNTPSHHRVHHATNPRYLDRNYAGILIIWDRWFGTFVGEVEAEPCRYGITANLGTFNPLRIAFHEWASIARDVWRARGWRHRLLYLFGPPGWSPDGSRHTAAEIRRDWAARAAADPES